MNFNIIYMQSFFWLWMTFTTKCNQPIDDGYVELCKPKGYGCDCPLYSDTKKWMDCSDRGLNNTSQYIQFPDLIESVNFRNNKIKSILQNTFVVGRNVMQLDISHNNIDFMHHSVFEPLERLQTLILCHNSIWSLDSNLFDGLQALQTLDLSYNRIQNWDNNLFIPCKRLMQLDLSYNFIGSTGLTSSAFQHLPRLETLSLQNTTITQLPDTIFADNYRLKYVYLSGNELKTVPNSALRSALSLTFVDLSETNLRFIQYEDFIGLKSLTEIRLERIRSLQRIEMNAFSDLENLQSFVCEHNYQLNEIHEKAFTNNMTGEAVRSLIHLSLRHNSLQTLSSQMVLWQDLHQIDLQMNPWHCDCRIGWMSALNAKHLSADTKCHEPHRLSGQLVKSLSAEDFVCQSSVINDSFVTSVILVVTFATLALSIIAVLVVTNTGCCRDCRFPFTNTRIHYFRQFANKDRVDLEWDDSAEP